MDGYHSSGIGCIVFARNGYKDRAHYRHETGKKEGKKAVDEIIKKLGEELAGK